jgi:hypothetical protein
VVVAAVGRFVYRADQGAAPLERLMRRFCLYAYSFLSPQEGMIRCIRRDGEQDSGGGSDCHGDGAAQDRPDAGHGEVGLEVSEMRSGRHSAEQLSQFFSRHKNGIWRGAS